MNDPSFTVLLLCSVSYLGLFRALLFVTNYSYSENLEQSNLVLFECYVLNGMFCLHSAGNNWSWVPIIGCFLGGILGALTYIGLIEMHHPPEDPRQPTNTELESIITSK